VGLAWTVIRPNIPQCLDRRLIRHQVRDYVASHAGEPIYIDDLAATVRLARRRLEPVFHDILGILPVAYLRIRRLQGARQALRESKRRLGAIKQIALD
jgi:AraC-like DNA-binding protein